MKTKRIVILAYCEKNLGDDLFLKILFERYRNVEWFILDSDKKNCEIFKKYNVNLLSKIEFLKNVRTFDGFINIGGSIFIQTRRWYGLFLKRLFYTIPLKILNKKLYIIGANFGPYNSNNFLNAYKWYFKLIDDICFREEKSYKLFNNVRIAPDIVFGLENNNIIKVKNSIGISIMDFSQRDELSIYHKKYIQKMVEIIRFALNCEYKVTLFSFCAREGDESAINEILNLLKESDRNKISLIYYRDDIDDFLVHYSKMENIVSLRFHSLILSQVFEQNVYPILYSQKTLNVLQDIGLDRYFIDIKKITNLNVKNLFKNLENNKVDIKKLRTNSVLHFKNLDRFMYETDCEK